MIDFQKTIQDKANEWVGLEVRYLHRGTSKTGCDCTGMIIGILNEMGFLSKYQRRNYPPDWNLHSGSGNYIVEELEKVAYEIPISDIMPGDILCFRFGKCIAHVGILLNKKNGVFAHCFVTSKKCCYGILRNSGFGSRFATAYRLDTDKMKRFS